MTTRLIQGTKTFRFTDLTVLRATLSGSQLTAGGIVYYTATEEADGQQHAYSWNSTSTDADDGVTTIKLDDTTTGRLKLIDAFDRGDTGSAERSVYQVLGYRPRSVMEFSGIDPTGATASDTALQNASAATAVGQILEFPRGQYLVTETLSSAVNMVHFKGEQAGPADSSSGVNVKWGGSGTDNMIELSGDGAKISGMRLSAESVAGCSLLYFGPGNSQGCEDILFDNFKATALKIGDDTTPNNNDFRGINCRWLYDDGGTCLDISSPATENVVFQTWAMSRTTAVGPPTPTRMIRVRNSSNAVFYDGYMDDNDFTGYCVLVEGGTASFVGSNIFEVKQFIQCTGVARNRPMVFSGIEARSCDPQSGQYFMDLRASGNDQYLYILNGVHVRTPATASFAPDILVSNATLFGAVFFDDQSGGSPGQGEIVSSSANIYNFGNQTTKSNVHGCDLRLHDDARLAGRVSGTTYDNLISAVSAVLTIGSDSNWTNARYRATTAHQMYVGGNQILQAAAAAINAYYPIIPGNGGTLGAGGIYGGSGSPEGVVTAPVGSTFHRSDGGAGTSFYVKESGSGNTGWVAK